MERSWTEPPPLAWVLIGGRKRWGGRRLSGPMRGGGPKRYGSALSRRAREHGAQGRTVTRSDKARW